MKTSVTKIMMSFALMGCLIIGASDASAQGRSRSQGGSSSSRSQSAAVSRSSSSSAPQMSRSSSSSSRSSAAPQVSRSSSSSSRSSATPQVGRSSTSSSRSSATPQVGRSGSGSSRSGHSATTRGGDNRGGSGNSGTTGSVTRHSDSKPHVSQQGTTQRVDRSTHNGSDARLGDRDRRGNRPGGNTGNGNHGNGNHGNGNHGNGNHGNGNMGNGNHGGGNHGNGGNHPDGNRPSSNRPGGHGGHSDNHGHGGYHGYNPDHRFDYSSHHYRDQFSWNHSHHNWSRPLPPPARPYRPAPLIWRRPVIPAGWHPYAGAPIIDRILGLMFGTLYEVSLDQLYYNGYYIDGYADNVIYLRDVTMLNLYWPDVMLSYEYGKLANAQFVYHSSYYDRTRFNRAYNSLCRIYGTPVYQDGMTISWYGGNNTGWVTLTMNDSYGDYYTTMSIGY